MKIKKITIDPDPYEPFRLAQGYRVGELLFISGQAAIDGNGQLVGIGNFDAQAKQVFANLERVLRAGGSSLENVIKVTIFLRDMSNFPKIVELRGRYFTPPYPADTSAIWRKRGFLSRGSSSWTGILRRMSRRWRSYRSLGSFPPR